MQKKLFETIIVDLEATGQLLIILVYSTIVIYLRKRGIQ